MLKTQHYHIGRWCQIGANGSCGLILKASVIRRCEWVHWDVWDLPKYGHYLRIFFKKKSCDCLAKYIFKIDFEAPFIVTKCSTRYLLFCAEHFTGWRVAFPTPMTAATELTHSNDWMIILSFETPLEFVYFQKLLPCAMLRNVFQEYVKNQLFSINFETFQKIDTLLSQLGLWYHGLSLETSFLSRIGLFTILPLTKKIWNHYTTSCWNRCNNS